MLHPLENKIPPPILALVLGGAMGLIAPLSFTLPIDSRIRLIISGALAVSALAVSLPAFGAFRRARTTINPIEPEAASVVVTTGIFRFTRNPMYVGLTTLLLAWAVYLAAPWALVGPVIFGLFITRFQIVPEERVLTQKFGAAYVQYKERVRRWL